MHCLFFACQSPAAGLYLNLYPVLLEKQFQINLVKLLKFGMTYSSCQLHAGRVSCCMVDYLHLVSADEIVCISDYIGENIHYHI